MRSVRARTEPRGNYGDMVTGLFRPKRGHGFGRGRSNRPGAGGSADHGVCIRRAEPVHYGDGFAGGAPKHFLSGGRNHPAGGGYPDSGVTGISPGGVGTREFTYASSNEEVATISQAGEITALAEGDAVVYARYGEMEAALQVHVEPAPTRYWVLLIGEQMYQSGVNTVRTGSVNTVYNLQSLFETAQYEGELSHPGGDRHHGPGAAGGGDRILRRGPGMRRFDFLHFLPRERPGGRDGFTIFRRQRINRQPIRTDAAGGAGHGGGVGGFLRQRRRDRRGSESGPGTGERICRGQCRVFRQQVQGVGQRAPGDRTVTGWATATKRGRRQRCSAGRCATAWDGTWKASAGVPSAPTRIIAGRSPCGRPIGTPCEG